MKCNREFDGRKLDHKTLEALRLRAVQQVIDGQSAEEVAEALQMNPRTVYRWLEKYHYGGWDALKAKPIPGRPPKLDARQMQWIAKTIRDQDPRQLKFPFALWTLAMVRQLIRDRFGVRLSEVSVGRLLKTLGFTPQRPLYRAWQQDPALVERWQKEEYPKIQARAKREQALIFFADESSIRSDYHAGTTWGQRGKTPVVGMTGTRYRLNMLSAVSATGHFRFMTVGGTVNASVFCDFLRRLAAGVEQKIFLIVDRHRIHRAKKVQRVLEELEGRITLFFLPPYAPELNPDELVWGHVKGRVGRQSLQSQEDLKRKVLAAMHSLQRMPDKIRGFFHTPTCVYAAQN